MYRIVPTGVCTHDCAVLIVQRVPLASSFPIKASTWYPRGFYYVNQFLTPNVIRTWKP